MKPDSDPEKFENRIRVRIRIQRNLKADSDLGKNTVCETLLVGLMLKDLKIKFNDQNFKSWLRYLLEKKFNNMISYIINLCPNP